MKNRIILNFIFLALSGLIGCGQESGRLYENVIEKGTLEKQIHYLASDEMMGRNTGTEEIKKAARYIAEYFESLGVREFPDAPGYLQEVPLKISEPAKHCNFELNNSIFSNGKELVLRSGEKQSVDGDIFYIAKELWEEKSGKRGVEGMNIKGKIVVAELGAGERNGFNEIFSWSEKKREIVKNMGGLALVELYDHSAPWNRLVPYLNRSSLELDYSGTDGPDGELTHIWIFVEDQNLTEKIRKGRIRSARIKSDGIRINKLKDQNVVGYIPGTDPDLKEEYILLTAHYDHLGAGMKNGRNATPEDTIFNGAGDNAMGTVAVMASAKAFSITPAQRPIIFLAVTGEEKGLLGSRYFADRPLVPLHQIIFNLNNDGAGMAETDIVNVLGLQRTGSASMITNACNQYGLKVNNDTVFKFLFNASDNISFSRKGIPSNTFSPGFRLFNMEMPKHYHRPSDEAETIDYDYYTKFVRAYARAARNIANAGQKPGWIIGDEFEKISKELYGKKSN